MPNIAMRDSDNITSTFEDMFEAHQFQQLVHRPTRGNSLLDLVLYNTPTLVRGINVGPPMGSTDHATLQFTIAGKIGHNVAQTKMVRDFKAANYAKINEHLAGVDWIGTLSNANSVDQMYELPLHVLYRVIELYMPWRKVDPDWKKQVSRITSGG